MSQRGQGRPHWRGLWIKDLNKGRDRAMGIFNRRAKILHFIPAWFVKIFPSADQHNHLKEHFRDHLWEMSKCKDPGVTKSLMYLRKKGPCGNLVRKASYWNRRKSRVRLSWKGRNIYIAQILGGLIRIYYYILNENIF